LPKAKEPKPSLRQKRAEEIVTAPLKEEVSSVQVVKPEQPVCYKQEIMVSGKRVIRLNDGRDTDSQFHCAVNNGEYSAHFDKSLFI